MVRALVVVGFAVGIVVPRGVAAAEPRKADEPGQWTVKELRKTKTPGLKIWAPDGKRFLVNKEDDNGVAQVYVGDVAGGPLKCITSTRRPGAPKPEKLKMQPTWHPSGDWVFMAVERDKYSTPPLVGAIRSVVEGMLQCGLWTNMYAVSPDGKHWHRLTDFKSDTPGTPDGYTGVAFTHDGKKAVWSQIVDGNIFSYYPFGKWEVMIADVEIKDAVPRLANPKNITPKGMHWNEPGNFHPDNETLLLTGSVEKDAQGMDQYLLNVRTNKLTNLTNSPKVWDEHGVFSPDGTKIIFMSSHPYRDDPKAAKISSIKAEFLLMNADGTGLTQLTRFREKGSKEFSEGIAACPAWHPDGKSATLSQLVFPKYDYWQIEFRTPAKK